MVSDGLAASAFLLSASLVAVGLLFLKMWRGDTHPASLIAIYTYAHTALFVVRPLYHWQFSDGTNLFQGVPLGDSYYEAVMLAGVGYVAVCLGYGLTAHGRAPMALPLQPMEEGAWRWLRTMLILIVILGALLYSQYIRSLGVERYFGILSEGRSSSLTEALAGVSGYYSTGLQFSLGALLLLAMGFVSRGQVRAAVASCLILFVVMLPQVATGSRSVFVPIAVALIVLVARVKPDWLSRGRMLFLGPILFVLLFIAPRTFRSTPYPGVSTWEKFRSAFTLREALENFVGGFDTAMVDAFALQVAAQRDGFIEMQNGQTYLNAMLAFVPRAMWSDKPGTVDQYLNAELFPVTASQRIGFSFGIYSEPFLNFGLVGVIVVMFMAGMALGKINSLRHAPNVFQFWVYAITAAYIFPIVRGSVSFDLQRALVSAVPVLLAVVVARVLTASMRRERVSNGS